MDSLFPDTEPDRREVYDGTPPSRKNASPTSASAAAMIAARAPNIRMRLLALVRERGELGLTSEEAGHAYAEWRDLPPETAACRLTAAARLCELAKAGLIKDSGYTRATAADASAVVWIDGDVPGDGRVCEVQT